MDAIPASLPALIEAGWHVRIEHIRRYKHLYTGRIEQGTKVEARMIGLVHPLAKGGETSVKILSPDEDLYGEGRARCRRDEQYSPKIGRELALERAIGALSSDLTAGNVDGVVGMKQMARGGFGELPAGRSAP